MIFEYIQAGLYQLREAGKVLPRKWKCPFLSFDFWGPFVVCGNDKMKYFCSAKVESCHCITVKHCSHIVGLHWLWWLSWHDGADALCDKVVNFLSSAKKTIRGRQRILWSHHTKLLLPPFAWAERGKILMTKKICLRLIKSLLFSRFCHLLGQSRPTAGKA